MSLYGDLPDAKRDARPGDDVPSVRAAPPPPSGPGEKGAAGPQRPAAWGPANGGDMANRANLPNMPSQAAIAALRSRHKKLELEREKMLKIKMARAKAAKAAATAAGSVSSDVPPSAADASGCTAEEQRRQQQQTSAHGVHGAGASLAAEYMDEYDPMKPNSYDICNARRIAVRERAEAERVRELQRIELEQQREKLRRTSSGAGANSTAGDATDSLKISGEEAFRRRAGITAPVVGANAESLGLGPVPALAGDARMAPEGSSSGKPGGKSAAERMMEKMGWREGRGLGKDGQGMTAPLVAKKIDARSGIIVEDAPRRSSTTARPGEAGAPGDPVIAPSRSRVIILRNVVGSGQVDADLESEIAEECSRFGEVQDIFIFEVPQPSTLPEEEAVRIFVKFADEEMARAALQVFDGRFFGGRSVRCSFFDERKFDAKDLAPGMECIGASSEMLV